MIGVLIEKEITSNDQYPLSLNALVNACNQKTNRDPVLNLSEACVQQTVDGLVKKFLVSNQTGYGSRVTKYQHRFCNTDFGDLKFSEKELGVICELLLRGPQTAGELRTRTERLCKFSDVSEAETVLSQLAQREQPLVIRLAKEPGKREARWAHLFSGEIHVDEPEEMQGAASGSDRERIALLEQQVQTLREEVEMLKQLFG